MYKDRIIIIVVTTIFLISFTSCLDGDPISQEKPRGQPTKRAFITKPKVTPVRNTDVTRHRIHPQEQAKSNQSINVSLPGIGNPTVVSTATSVTATPNTVAPILNSIFSSQEASPREGRVAIPEYPLLSTSLAIPSEPQRNQMLSTTSTSSSVAESLPALSNPLHQDGIVRQRIDPANIPVATKNAINNGERQSIRGLLLEVSAGSLKEISTLILEDKFGDRHSFIHIDQIVNGVTPLHLKEHMEQHWPVTIVFHWSNDSLVIDEITD